MMNDIQFAQMVEQHKSMLNGFALKFTGDTDDANDLIQDTMVKALRFSSNFEAGTNIKGWLYTIMRNTFINDYRKNTKKQSIIIREEEISSANLLKSASQNKGESTFAMRDIQLAISKLPEPLSKAFISYFEGYKYHEISKAMHLPLGTVKTYIHEARKRLKKYLVMYQNKISN